VRNVNVIPGVRVRTTINGVIVSVYGDAKRGAGGELRHLLGTSSGLRWCHMERETGVRRVMYFEI
jgi:hypothetical protein